MTMCTKGRNVDRVIPISGHVSNLIYSVLQTLKCFAWPTNNDTNITLIR